MTTGEAVRIRQWLQRRWHVVVPDDWLEACLEWIYQENQGALPSSNDLNNMVYEQWLLSDLREIGSHCLPPGAALQPKTELSGYFCLQVDSVIDVSSPYYSQLQKVTGTENANVHVSATQATQPSWEAKSTRMLLMKLTDGTQDIQGMEYQAIPCLSTSLTPGSKVLLSGSILCRLGVMMLKRENVTLLGGEVESLLETTQVKLLQSALGRNSELGQNPPKEERAEFSREETRRNAVSESRRPVQQELAWPAQSVDTNRQPPPVKQPNNFQNRFQGSEGEFPDDDDSNFLDHMDTAQLDAMEEQWEDDVDYDAIMEQLDRSNAVGARPAANSGSSNRGRLTEGPSHLVGSRSRNDQNKSVSKPGAPDRAPPCKKSCTSSRLDECLAQNSRVDIRCRGNIGQQHAADVSSFRQCSLSFGVPRSDQNTSKKFGIKEECQSNTMPHVKVSSSQQRGLDSFVNRTVKSEPSDHPRMQGLQNTNSYPVSRRIQVPVCKEQFSLGPSVTQIKGEVKDEMFEDMDFIDLTEGMEAEESQSLLKPNDLMPLPTSSLGPQSQTLSVTELVDRYLKGTLARKRQDYTLRLDALPYTYLSRVVESWPPPVLETVRVKAYISTLLSRLEHNNGKQWSLKVKINDGSAAMDVDLGDQMLSTLIGFTAPECLKMKAIAKNDHSLRLKITEGIKHCQLCLIGLSCILELELTGDRPRPYVKRHFNLRPEDLSILKNRIINGYCSTRL